MNKNNGRIKSNICLVFPAIMEVIFDIENFAEKIESSKKSNSRKRTGKLITLGDTNQNIFEQFISAIY